jgi:hypothetical protein
MSTVTNKTKILSVEEKLKMLRVIENGRQKTDVCREFGLVNSTVQTICKNGTRNISLFEHIFLKIKQFESLKE